MNTKAQIAEYISSLPEPKRADLAALHHRILRALPGCKLRFYDGKNSNNETVANPAIGYGSHTMHYADGKSREWFRIGISANKTGISVYILGVEDKNYLAQTYAKKLGKATVTGYCIKFKSLKEIDVEILEEAIRKGVEKDLS